MENLGIIVGIAVAVAVATYYGRRNAPRTQRARSSLIALVVAAVAAAAAVYGLRALSGGDEVAQADQALAEARALPMVGLVLDDVPGTEARLRAALREEIRSPTTDGPSRPLVLMSELRASHIVPALKASDDASALAVIGARVALLRYLQGANQAACQEFALVGIQRSDRLDEAGQKSLRGMLTALEAAYRSGRTAIAAGGAPARTTPSDTEAGALLDEAGFKATDLDKLRRLTRLSPGEACELAIKLNEAPAKLPADKSGPLARYLAAAQ